MSKKLLHIIDKQEVQRLFHRCYSMCKEFLSFINKKLTLQYMLLTLSLNHIYIYNKNIIIVETKDLYNTKYYL